MKRSALPTRLLLFGTALLLPCFLFTAGNVLLSPWPLYHRSRLCLLLLTPVCLAFLLFLLPRIAGILSPLLQRRERVVLCIFAAAFFLVQVALSLTLRHIPITDAEQCFTAASLLCDTGAFETSERAYVYFSRYPFNLGFVYLLSALFRFCGWLGWTDRFAAAVVFAALLFAAGLLCTAKLTRRLGGPGAQARLLVLFPLCLPFLTCCAEVYTDVFAVSFPPMILLAFQNTLDAKSRRNRLLHALSPSRCSPLPASSCARRQPSPSSPAFSARSLKGVCARFSRSPCARSPSLCRARVPSNPPTPVTWARTISPPTASPYGTIWPWACPFAWTRGTGSTGRAAG